MILQDEADDFFVFDLLPTNSLKIPKPTRQEATDKHRLHIKAVRQESRPALMSVNIGERRLMKSSKNWLS